MTRRALVLVAALALAAGALVDCRKAPEECEVCHRPMHAETHYAIHLEDGDAVSVCCPRCGLRFQAERSDVAGAEVADFTTRKLLDAERAFFVEGSSVQLCAHSRMKEDRSGTVYQVSWDRCLPSLVGFESRQTAEAFRRANGGSTRTYEELLAEIR